MVTGSRSWLAVGLATVIDLGAVALLIVGPLTAVACWLALALHVGATASLLLARGVPGSRRGLVIAFGFTIPLVGAAAAVLSLAKGGQSELEMGMAEEEQRDSSSDAALIRAVAEALAAPEALLVADAEQRRAMLWGLGRRGDAEAIALLRWALTAASNELGMEAALALEDLTIGFEKRLDAARRTLEEAPTRAAALAAAELITSGFETGILDVALIDAFAGEARQDCALALQLDHEAIGEVAIARARFELAILRPDIALDVLDEALPAAAPALHAELRHLRAESALRANDLPWEGASALLTYRRPLPPRALLHPRRTSSTTPVEARQTG